MANARRAYVASQCSKTTCAGTSRPSHFCNCGKWIEVEHHVVRGPSSLAGRLSNCVRIDRRLTRRRSPCCVRHSASPHCKSLSDPARIGTSPGSSFLYEPPAPFLRERAFSLRATGRSNLKLNRLAPTPVCHTIIQRLSFRSQLYVPITSASDSSGCRCSPRLFVSGARPSGTPTPARAEVGVFIVDLAERGCNIGVVPSGAFSVTGRR